MNYIEEFCDGIAIINGGEVVLTGDIHEIKRNYPRNRLVVRSPQAEAIAKAYGAGASLQNGEEVLITLSSPAEKQNAMQSLVASFDVDEIKVFEPSLNDIFVEYTKDRI